MANSGNQWERSWKHLLLNEVFSKRYPSIPSGGSSGNTQGGIILGLSSSSSLDSSSSQISALIASMSSALEGSGPSCLPTTALSSSSTSTTSNSANTNSTTSLARFFTCLEILIDRIAERYPQNHRHLLLEERDYILIQLGEDKAHYKKEDIEGFWDWFGASFFLLRDVTKNLPLWANGIILGFISKQKAEDILHGKPQGTFLIRFSRQMPHRFCISYVSTNNNNNQFTIQHSLLPDEDCKLNLAELLTAPRFSVLVHLLVLNIQPTSSPPPAPVNFSQPPIISLPKHQVLQQFQKTKKHATDDTPDKLKSMGYSPNFF